MTLHTTGQPPLRLPPIFFEAFLSSVRTLNFRGVTLAPGPCKLSQLTKFTLEIRLDSPGRRDHEPEKRSDLRSEANTRLCFYRHARLILCEDRYRCQRTPLVGLAN